MLFNLYSEIYKLENSNCNYKPLRAIWKTMIFLYNYIILKVPKLEHPIYVYKNKVYYVLIEKCHSKILSIKHKGEDVSNKINMYLGPMENFHGYKATPIKLGYDELDFEYIDDCDLNIVSKRFKQNETIIF